MADTLCAAVDVANQVSQWLVDEKEAAARAELDEAVLDAKPLRCDP